jgi:excisionase family DNA binding protein
MPDREHPATLTVEQAGELLGISPRSAYRAVAAGHLPVIRLGRRLLVPTTHLERMLSITPEARRGDRRPEPSARRRGPPVRRKRGPVGPSSRTRSNSPLVAPVSIEWAGCSWMRSSTAWAG